MKTFDIRQNSLVGMMKSATENILAFAEAENERGKGRVTPADSEEKWAIVEVEDMTVKIYSASCVALLPLLEPEREESLWGSQ